jgi:hypothetical protein
MAGTSASGPICDVGDVSAPRCRYLAQEAEDGGDEPGPTDGMAG